MTLRAGSSSPRDAMSGPRDVARWSLALLLSCCACSEQPPPSVASSATSAAAAPPIAEGSSSAASHTSAAVAQRPAASASASMLPEVAVERPSMARFRAEAERDRSAMAGKPVALDVVHRGIRQREFGRSSGHAGGYFVVVDVAFADALDDTLACQLPIYQWLPAGAKVGDTLHVEGVWSFDTIRTGGMVEGGGPLEIHSCKVSKPVPAP